MNHESHESARAWTGLLCVLCASVFIFVGCGTPAGYDADLTPDHDGEQYIGGAQIQTAPVTNAPGANAP